VGAKALGGSGESQNEGECVVDGPLLVWGETAGELVQSFKIDCSELLDENT